MQRDLDVSVHIRRYRRALGLSLREVALASRCSKNYVHQAELRKGDCSIYTLGHIADRLEIAPWLLVTYPQWPVPPPCTCPCHSQQEG